VLRKKAFYEFFDDITEINYFDSAMEQQIKKAFVIFYQMTRHNPLVSRLSAFLKSKRTSKTAKNMPFCRLSNDKK